MKCLLPWPAVFKLIFPLILDVSDWPSGYELREILRADSDATGTWKHNKWVWRSTGMKNKWRKERRKCQGVIECRSCGHRIRPKTQADAMKSQINNGCPNVFCANPAALVHVSCEAFTLHWSESRLEDGQSMLYWEHHGEHEHHRPPGGFLSKAQENALDEQVLRRPEASAHELRTGSVVPGSIPLGEISPMLSKPSTARYHVRKSQVRVGVQPSTTGKNVATSLQHFGEVNERLNGFIVDSKLHGPIYIMVQSSDMRDWLKEAVEDWLRADAEGPTAGRHGFVTDGDHSFFRDGTLLTTVAFNLVLKQWVPVLYTWVASLDKAHHRVHFNRLNHGVIEAAGSRFTPALLAGVRFVMSSFKHYLLIQKLQVFDFSLGQLGGHEEAFADALITVFGPKWSSLTVTAQSAERQKYLEQARDFEKGCTTHFHRSDTRIRQDGSLIPPDQRDYFQEFINDFLSPDVTRLEFDGAVAEFRKMFPAVVNWLDWWLRPKIAGMIFPACRTMDSELADALPNTSNPVETQHSLLHHSTGTSRELNKGIEELYLHTAELKIQYDAIQGMYYQIH